MWPRRTLWLSFTSEKQVKCFIIFDNCHLCTLCTTFDKPMKTRKVYIINATILTNQWLLFKLFHSIEQYLYQQ